jgi:5-methylcytosine-specific restriction endonuclease McrA
MAARDRRAYRRKAARLKRTATDCWICGEPIDPGVHYLDPRAFTADHVDPIGRGGHVLGDLKPAHRSCNSRRGTRDLEHEETSRDW